MGTPNPRAEFQALELAWGPRFWPNLFSRRYPPVYKYGTLQSAWTKQALESLYDYQALLYKLGVMDDYKKSVPRIQPYRTERIFQIPILPPDDPTIESRAAKRLIPLQMNRVLAARTGALLGEMKRQGWRMFPRTKFQKWLSNYVPLPRMGSIGEILITLPLHMKNWFSPYYYTHKRRLHRGIGASPKRLKWWGRFFYNRVFRISIATFCVAALLLAAGETFGRMKMRARRFQEHGLTPEELKIMIEFGEKNPKFQGLDFYKRALQRPPADPNKFK
jgi:hypothetical protein